MTTVTKILVANDQLDGFEAALSKAYVVEHYTGCDVEVAEVLWDSVEEEHFDEEDKARLINLLMQSERKDLEALLEPYKDKIAASEVRVLWQKDAAEAIAEEVSRAKVDLLIKPARPHALKDHFSAPLDWRLVRGIPCPVLISKSASWQTGGSVLVALDAANPGHTALNERIVATAQTLAGVLDARIELVSTYPNVGRLAAERQVAMDYAKLQDDIRAARRSALQEIADKLPGETGIHVAEGRADVVIPELAEELAVTVTVMGTHARGGISKWVLGNTAESLLPRIQGDVVTVHPPA